MTSFIWSFILSSVEQTIEEDDSYSSASSEAEVQSVIDSSCYERHDLANSYVCTEVTALDKVESGKLKPKGTSFIHYHSEPSDITESDGSTRATSIRTEELNIKLTNLVGMDQSEDSDQSSDDHNEVSPISPSQAVRSWLDQAPSELGTPESVRSSKEMVTLCFFKSSIIEQKSTFKTGCL